MYCLRGGGGGGSRPFNFENMILTYGLRLESDGLDMYQLLEDGFRSMRAILPMLGIGAKNGSKTKNLAVYSILFVLTS